jgi:hypothetical protein
MVQSENRTIRRFFWTRNGDFGRPADNAAALWVADTTAAPDRETELADRFF